MSKWHDTRCQNSFNIELFLINLVNNFLQCPVSSVRKAPEQRKGPGDDESLFLSRLIQKLLAEQNIKDALRDISQCTMDGNEVLNSESQV